jgi:hypothetical protein
MFRPRTPRESFEQGQARLALQPDYHVVEWPAREDGRVVRPSLPVFMPRVRDNTPPPGVEPAPPVATGESSPTFGPESDLLAVEVIISGLKDLL